MSVIELEHRRDLECERVAQATKLLLVLEPTFAISDEDDDDNEKMMTAKS